MHLHHEGSMIGVQCQLMICRGHIGTSKATLKNFSTVDGSMIKLTSKSNFALLSLFQLRFERVVNGLGGQNHINCQSEHGLSDSSVKKNF